MDMYSIKEMTPIYASNISCWKYAGEYALYSFQNDEETMAELLGGQYLACINTKEELVGYFCFGKAAQIPAKETGIYQDNCVDIGLGLKPELCGKGLGADFMRAGIDYADSKFHFPCLRLTVACFNKRAISLYEKMGFKTMKHITHKRTNADFYLMIRDNII